MPQELHRIQAENARKIWSWLQTRGGLYLWRSVNFSNLEKSWTGPAHNEDGTVATKPSWESDTQPSRHIVDPQEVIVDTAKEVKRFHVAVRMGGQGFTVKCTDGATRRIRKAVSKASSIVYAERCKVEGPKPENENLAWYEFDYETQEAVILVPDKSVSLKDFVLEHLGDF